MNSVNKWVAGGVILAVAIGIFSLAKERTVKVDVNPVINVPAQTQNLGAVAGPDFDFPNSAVNRVRSHYENQSIRGATSTVCSFKTPSASTTLAHVSANVLLNTGGTELVIAHALNNFATTTLLTKFTDVASARFSLAATSSKNTTLMPLYQGIVRPNTFINVSLMNQTSATGTCNVIFTEL